MQTQYYKEFLVLAQTLNYWAAADKLFISQSVLSKHIKAMERELGSPLFRRSSRKVALTELGEKLLPLAEKICRLQAEAAAAAAQYSHSGPVRLRIATLPDIARYGFSRAVIQFRRQFSYAELEVEEMDTQPALDALLAGRCALAICRQGETVPPAQQLQLYPLFSERLMAVLPPDKAQAGQTEVVLSSLAGCDLALLARGSLPHSICVDACQCAGFSPQIRYTSHRVESILDMVSGTGCTALLFENHLPADKSRSGIILPVVPPVYSTIYLALRQENHTPQIDFMVQCCQQAMAKPLSRKNSPVFL